MIYRLHETHTQNTWYEVYTGYIWNIIHVLSSKEGIHRTQDTKDTHWLEKLEKYIFVTCATARDLGAPSNSP